MSRIFVIGSTRIAENDSTAHLTNPEVAQALSPIYPEVKNATISEKTEGDDTIVTFLSQPGRKG